MVFVIEHVHKVSIERVNVVQLRELVQHGRQLVVKVLLSELDFSGVELPDSGDLVVFVDHSRGLALSLGQDDVYEVLGRRYDSDLLEVVVSHLEADHVFTPST